MSMQATASGNAVHLSAIRRQSQISKYDQSSWDIADGRALDRAMLHLGVVMSFRRSQEVFCDDEPADRVYKVLAGTVCTCKILSDGRRQINAFYLTNECFGLECADRHSYAAEALSDAKILVVKRVALMAIAGRDAVVARQLLVLTARELARVQNRVLLLAKTAEERVVGFLLELANRSAKNSIELPMLRRDIGDYLGLTIETVSRTLKSLKDHAAIEVSARRVVLRNRSRLSRIND